MQTCVQGSPERSPKLRAKHAQGRQKEVQGLCKTCVGVLLRNSCRTFGGGFQECVCTEVLRQDLNFSTRPSCTSKSTCKTKYTHRSTDFHTKPGHHLMTCKLQKVGPWPTAKSAQETLPNVSGAESKGKDTDILYWTYVGPIFRNPLKTFSGQTCGRIWGKILAFRKISLS